MYVVFWPLYHFEIKSVIFLPLYRLESKSSWVKVLISEHCVISKENILWYGHHVILKGSMLVSYSKVYWGNCLSSFITIVSNRKNVCCVQTTESFRKNVCCVQITESFRKNVCCVQTTESFRKNVCCVQTIESFGKKVLLCSDHWIVLR